MIFARNFSDALITVSKNNKIGQLPMTRPIEFYPHLRFRTNRTSFLILSKPLQTLYPAAWFQSGNDQRQDGTTARLAIPLGVSAFILTCFFGPSLKCQTEDNPLQLAVGSLRLADERLDRAPRIGDPRIESSP